MIIDEKQIPILIGQRIPEFNYIIDEHYDEYRMLLLHVLFGDLTRFLIRIFQQRNNGAENLKIRIFDFIEEIYIFGTPSVKEAVEASILENLHQAKENYDEIKKYLRRNTAKKLLSMENWEPKNL